MGDIADMMLDGTLCEMCGVYLEGEADGFPRYCSAQCARDRGASYAPATPTKAKCHICGKRVRAAGMADHVRDKHTGERA